MELPKFEELPPVVSLGPGTNVIKGKSGVYAGARYIYPVGAEHAADAWFQPYIAVGAIVVWTGTPERESEGAFQTAINHLANAMRALCNSELV